MIGLQALIFTVGLVCAAVYDARTRLVDDRVCWLIALAGLITVSPASLLGAILAGLPFYLGAGFKKNGGGDVCLAAASGFVLGPTRTIAGLSLFLFLFAGFILLHMLQSWIRHKPMIKSCALVPLIAAGFIPAYFFA